MEATLTPYTEAAQNILDVILKGEYDHYGLRCLSTVTKRDETRRAPKVGTILPNSRVWVDGQRMREELPGVCAHRLDTWSTSLEEVERKIKTFGREGYYGRFVVLVGGQRGIGGEDSGEVIIHEGRVLGVWAR